MQAEENLLEVRGFLSRLGVPQWVNAKPVWQAVSADGVLEFLRRYRTDPQARSISLPLICAYIERQVAQGELVNWTVAVRGRETPDRRLGEANWGVSGGQIWQMSRTRIRDTDSVGVITSPGDEAIGLALNRWHVCRNTCSRVDRIIRPRGVRDHHRKA